jgi:hypothetical protein
MKAGFLKGSGAGNDCDYVCTCHVRFASRYFLFCSSKRAAIVLHAVLFWHACNASCGLFMRQWQTETLLDNRQLRMSTTIMCVFKMQPPPPSTPSELVLND